MNLINLIKYYYEQRNLKWPNKWEAMAFVSTELGEVYELLLSESGGWVRNNPQNKPDFNKDDLAKELGDGIMMLLVEGIINNVNPLEALENKLQTKLVEKGLEKYCE